ncbi:MAG: hypothetical protein ABSA41_09390 [Terriglobia bacterium]
MKIILWWLTLLLTCSPCLICQEPPKPLNAATPKDALSLQRYYAAMLRAYKRGDAAKYRQFVSDLELPHKDAWLKQEFGPDQAAVLSKEYAQSFENFSARLVKVFGQAPTSEAEITITRVGELSDRVSPPAGAPAPKRKISMESYKFVLTVTPDETMEWMTSFVQVDGVLRYIGGGAFPFWEDQN